MYNSLTVVSLPVKACDTYSCAASCCSCPGEHAVTNESVTPLTSSSVMMSKTPSSCFSPSFAPSKQTIISSSAFTVMCVFSIEQGKKILITKNIIKHYCNIHKTGPPQQPTTLEYVLNQILHCHLRRWSQLSQPAAGAWTVSLERC